MVGKNGAAPKHSAQYLGYSKIRFSGAKYEDISEAVLEWDIGGPYSQLKRSLEAVAYYNTMKSPRLCAPRNDH